MTVAVLIDRDSRVVTPIEQLYRLFQEKQTPKKSQLLGGTRTNANLEMQLREILGFPSMLMFLCCHLLCQAWVLIQATYKLTMFLALT